jgi:hypothetical protein
MSEENIRLTEAAMRRAIHESNNAERMYKTFNQFPEHFIKERLASEYWKGRLTETKNRFKELSNTRKQLIGGR